ncbi:MFS transporter [Catenulispora subtropica]|uniref:MFS transporter n=1 Tax=Catenulispora subtropica TaxID=450798 RepID=A0ABN2TFQ0_9ACTN
MSASENTRTVTAEQPEPHSVIPGVADLSDAHKYRALAVCLLVGFMTLLDVSIVNVALPSMQKGLHATPADLSWVVSGYALTFGLILVPAGVFGDMVGRRTAFLAGLAAFTVASGLCGIAPSATFLVVSRLVQGLASGVLGPQISGLIQEMFSGGARARAFGYFGATVGLATAVGPLAGGLLIAAGGEEHGWRWVFFVNLPIGVVAFALALRLIPGCVGAGMARMRGRIDWIGVALLGGSVIAVMLPLVQEQQWTGRGKWWLVVLGVLLLAALALWERRMAASGRTPLVPPSLLRIGSYTRGATLALLYFGGFTTIFFIFTLFLQDGLHYSALEAGLATTPFALGSAVSATLGGRLVGKHGRALVILGIVLVTVATGTAILVVHWVHGRGAGVAAAAPLLVAGVGSGLVIAPNLALALSEVPVARAGTAGGVMQTGQRLGSALGIACVSSVFFSRVGEGKGYANAFQAGAVVAICFEVAALLVGLVDWRSRKAAGAGDGPGARPAA